MNLRPAQTEMRVWFRQTRGTPATEIQRTIDEMTAEIVGAMDADGGAHVANIEVKVIGFRPAKTITITAEEPEL